MEGKVIRYKTDKGFGFIRGPDEEEIYFRKSDLDPSEKKRIDQDDWVLFDVEDTDRGPRAVRIKILKKGLKTKLSAEWTINEAALSDSDEVRELLLTVTLSREKRPAFGIVVRTLTANEAIVFDPREQEELLTNSNGQVSFVVPLDADTIRVYFILSVKDNEQQFAFNYIWQGKKSKAKSVKAFRLGDSYPVFFWVVTQTEDKPDAPGIAASVTAFITSEEFVVKSCGEVIGQGKSVSFVTPSSGEALVSIELGSDDQDAEAFFALAGTCIQTAPEYIKKPFR